MLNKNKYKLMQINMILFLIMFVFTFDFVNGQKTLRVELDDGHIRHNAVQNITELTFEDDACDGVRKVTYSGKIYTTVQIGNQCWLEQNLNLGTLINASSEQTANTTIEKYCYYNDEAYCNTYGGLYQWHEAMQYSTSEDAKGICPQDWHIPTSAEFSILLNLANNNVEKLNEVGQGLGGSTNTFGFSALLSGYRFLNEDDFLKLGGVTNFWSSTESNLSAASSLLLQNDEVASSAVISSSTFNFKVFGYSIRCIKD